MAHKKQDWENIYKDYMKSGLERGEYIKKHQLSTYAFEKFKKLDAEKNTKDVKTKKGDFCSDTIRKCERGTYYGIGERISRII